MYIYVVHDMCVWYMYTGTHVRSLQYCMFALNENPEVVRSLLYCFVS